MTIKTTTNIITNIDTFIVMIRKHIITVEGTPKGIGTSPETTPIDTEKRENLQNATGTRINNLSRYSSNILSISLALPDLNRSTCRRSSQKLNACMELL